MTVAAACTAAPAVVGSDSGGCAKSPRIHRFMAQMTVNGLKRTALVNVPSSVRSATPLPLVLMFHGAGGDGRDTESWTGMTNLGNREGFITVYPNAVARYWDVTGLRGRGNDVVFVDSLLDRLEARLCVDDSRVYAAGVSNGASFVARIGCELSDRLTAIATVAGGYGIQPACQPRRPVSVLEIHGTSDRTVPYYGRGPNGQTGVWPFLSLWSDRDGCARTPPVWRRLGPRALWAAKAGCQGDTTVAHIKLIGEPHSWPTIKRVKRGTYAGVSFSGRWAVWQFFATGTVD
jgi:polyhydroxybutyrate depolymerase